MDMHASDAFSQAFDYAAGVTSRRFQNPAWRLTELFTGRKFRRALADVHAFGASIVEAAAEQGISGDATDDATGSSATLMQSLLLTISDPRIVADAALNYLSAGRDTTAQALTWTLHLLSSHASVLAAARAEVSACTAAHTPAALPYTLGLLYEALRLYPPVPVEMRQTARAVQLPDGTALPAGAVVLWSIWAIGRSTRWVDAAAVRPERWLREGRFVPPAAAELPVFNGGARLCLGKGLAERVAVAVLAPLLLRWDVEGPEVARVAPHGLTLAVDGGLLCRVRPRADPEAEAFVDGLAA
jgi:cytochrome P450